MECHRKFKHRKTAYNTGNSTQTTDYNFNSKLRKLNVTVQTKPSLKHKDSGIETLDDSLNSLEDTQVLINQNNIENINTNNIIGNIKAYNLNDEDIASSFIKTDLNCTVLQSLSDDYDDSQISQFFNKTQVLKQIDSVVSEANSNITNSPLSFTQSLSKLFENDCEFRNSNEIEVHTVNLHPECIEENKQVAKDETTKSFIDKEEFDGLFSKLETTIRDMGNCEHSDTVIVEDNEHKNKSIKLLNTIVQKVNNTKPDQEDQWFSEIGGLLNITDIEAATTSTESSLLNEFETQGFAREINELRTFKSLGKFYDLPDQVKHLIKTYRSISKLYDWQEECLSMPAVKNRKNLIYALPTSGGKTLVAEILLLREVLCRNKNVIFIMPFVAIVQEKIWALSPFAVTLNFLIEEYAAGKGVYPPRKRRRKNSVYIATIEKALGLVNSLIETERLSEIGLVIIDELHLIGDTSRGPTLEALLTKLMHMNSDTQIIGMSATIGNLNEVATFLNAEIYSRNFRPVDLAEYVKCNDDIAKINYNASDSDDLFHFTRKLEAKYSEALLRTDPDKITALVMEVVPHSSCLIFCATKKNCENVALLLCKVMFCSLKEYKKTEKAALLDALKKETQNLCKILKISIQFGVAYHHSGLTTEERQLIEHGFREGIISVICCTSTLAAGVNLPAKRVILRQPYIGRDFINLSRYKQMVGRAGRAGFEEYGESFIICNQLDLPKLKNMLMAPMDMSLSNMHVDKELMQFILSCITLNLAQTRAQLQALSAKTLLAVQESKLDVNLKELVDKAIIELFNMRAILFKNDKTQTNSGNGMSIGANGAILSGSFDENTKTKIVLKNDRKLEVSNLGLAAIKGGLPIEKAHILYEDLIQAQASLVLLNCLHLIYLVTPYDVSEQIQISRPHYYNIYSQLTKSDLETAKILGINEVCALKMLTNKPITNVPERVLNRFYVSLMLLDLWNEMSVHLVAEKYQVNRGIVQNLMVSAASFASNVVNFCAVLEEFWPFVSLLNGMSLRLQHCSVRELTSLMELPNVKQSRAKQLYNAGYKTLQSIAKANPNDLVEKIEFLPFKVANQLIATSKLLLLEKVENLREEAENVLDGAELSS